MSELSDAWQEQCTKQLIECVAMGASAGALEWVKRKKVLAQEAIKKGLSTEGARIIIADADFTANNLSDFSFQFCYIIRTNFTDAKLRNTNFDRASVRKCRLVRADIRGANFDRCSVDDMTLGWDAKIDNRSQLSFAGGSDALVGFGAYFRARGRRSGSRRRAQNHRQPCTQNLVHHDKLRAKCVAPHRAFHRSCGELLCGLSSNLHLSP